MKNILIIENDLRLRDVMLDFHDEIIKNNELELQLITNVRNADQRVLGAALAKADILAVMTTFLDEQQNLRFVQLLAQIKKPMQIWIVSDKVERELRGFMEDKDFFDTIQHTIFEFNPYDYIYDRKDFLKQIDFSEDANRYRNFEKARLDHLNFLSTNYTGKKVKILNLHAWGNQWSKLKSGDIVAELDCSSIDPQPLRGIWVMGLTEPVKLINESGIQEYEYVTELGFEDAITNIVKFLHCENTNKNRRFIEGVIRSDDQNTWFQATELLDEFGIPRRGNRSYLDSLIKNLNLETVNN